MNTNKIRISELYSNPEKIQKLIEKDQFLYLEFKNDLSIAMSKDNIYVDSWEEGNYSMNNNLLQRFDIGNFDQSKSQLYYYFDLDIEKRYSFLDKIFENCKYCTVKNW